MTSGDKFNITYRKANRSDFEGILRLQHQNLLSQKQGEDPSQGFLSIELAREQLHKINNELGIFVAVHDKSIIGYVMAETVEFAVKSPLMAHMLKRLKDKVFNGFPVLSSCFIYGPVCIDSRFRGKGILESLFMLLKQNLKNNYDVGIAFVSRLNARSYHAHTSKLKMRIIDDFEYMRGEYYTLAFKLK